jgi:hypothetical protein
MSEIYWPHHINNCKKLAQMPGDPFENAKRFAYPDRSGRNRKNETKFIIAIFKLVIKLKDGQSVKTVPRDIDTTALLSDPICQQCMICLPQILPHDRRFT